MYSQRQEDLALFSSQLEVKKAGPLVCLICNQTNTIVPKGAPVALADARRTVVAPTVGEGDSVEAVDRLSIGSDEGEVKRACGLPLDQRQVFSACWPKDHRRSPRLRRRGHVDGPGAQGLQRRSIESAGAVQVRDPYREVIEDHGAASHAS